ncbi:MAG: bifunctional hydroxymethylpyrimidine kinase/phosphomethylpyrimidine kinase [Gemmatimonas sp.]
MNVSSPHRGRVLVVAGSDSGGGAGIQADIKTVTALGGYAATAITALTAQNTLGVDAVQVVPPAFVIQQMELVLDDIGADAIKTGMLPTAAIIDSVCNVIETWAEPVPLVVDPVMVAKGGAQLLEPDAVDVLKSRLIFLADVITPNVPEAEVLTGLTINDEQKMAQAATMLLTLGCEWVLLKGGHLEGPEVVDVLASQAGLRVYRSPRIDTTSTHGTGCTLASAIATGLAQGLSVPDAVARARAYVQAAIAAAPGFGEGHGPLWHGHTVRSFPVPR